MSHKRAKRERHQGNGGLQPPAEVPITTEQTGPLLKVMIAESALGFERRLNTATNAHEWRGLDPSTGEDSGWIGIEDLPDFPGNDSWASRMVTDLCENQKLVVTFNYEPAHPEPGKRWECGFMERTPQGLKLLCSATSSAYGYAACGAITRLYELDLAPYHKLLFPGDYLET